MKAGSFNSLFKKVPVPEKRLFWLCVVILIKFTLLFFLVRQNRPTTITGTIAVCSGDCDSYLVPVDNLVNSGSYQPDYRMPGYGFPYLLFRLFLEKNKAADMLIVFQTFIDALASFILALTLFKITGRRISFYLTLIFYGLSVTVSCYNNWILTESLTASVLIFGFYYFVLSMGEPRWKNLMLSGLFFSWAYFLRPVNLPLLLFPLLIILIYLKDARLKSALFFILPAFILQSSWTIRNFYLKDKFIILTENPYLSMYKKSTIENWNFCKTFSDFKVTNCFFEPMGLTYFGQSLQMLKIEDIHFPAEIYTEDFNYDSLLSLRNYYDELNAPGTNPERKNAIDNYLVEKCRFYAQSIRKHHPFLVYIKTPLLLTKNFVFQSGVHNLFFYPFSYLAIQQKIIKLFYISIYWTAFILFLAGLFFFPRQIIDNKLILFSYLVTFYIIFIHSVFLRSIEPRYIIPAYAFVVAGSVYFINNLMKKLKH